MKGKVLKSSAWYVISNFLVKGITILTIPIFTRIMNQNDIGAYSNITSWINIFTIIMTFNLFNSVMLAKFDYEKEFNQYISSNLFLGTLITFVFYLIVLIFKDCFMNLLEIDFITLNLIFIYLLFYPSLQMLQIKNKVEYKYKLSSFLIILTTLLSLGCSIIFVNCSKDMLKGRIWGFYIPTIIISIIVYIFLIIKGKKISPKYWKYSLAISFPLVWHTLANNLLASSDRIMISKLINNVDTAKYTIAYSCAMFVTVLSSSLNSAITPWIFENIKTNNLEKIKIYVKKYVIFFFIIILCYMFVTPEILYFLGGESYKTAINIVSPVIVGYIFQFIYTFYISIETYYKKQKNIAIGTILAALINIILNFIFIPKYGYIAAAYTTLIGYIVLFIIHCYSVNKMKKDFYDRKFFMFILIISLFMIGVFNFLYKYNGVRYFCIIIIGVSILSIIKKKNIITEIKKMVKGEN